jgi:hypothetical protein
MNESRFEIETILNHHSMEFSQSSYIAGLHDREKMDEVLCFFETKIDEVLFSLLSC